jgi:hypothetical protein
MSMIRYVWPIVLAGLSACTWVEPTREGSEVALVEAHKVEGCKRVGTAGSSVKHEVGIYTRSEEKVAEELVILGKNKAAEMGGDTIVAQGEPVDGTMKFDVYKCGG